MTIVHILSSFSGGGAENMVLQLAKQSNQNVKTVVISISQVNTITNAASIEDKFIQENIEVHCLDITSFKNASLKRGLKKLNAITKTLEHPVFHCHMFHSVLLATFLNIAYTRVPVVFTLHTNKLESISRRWLLFLTKSFRKKDIIFSINSKKWYLKNSKVIPNGVDFEYFSQNITLQQEVSKPFVFLFLGRLHTPKNPLYMVTAAKLLIDNNITEFVIHVVGGGDMEEELKEHIDKNNVSKHFKLLGFHNNVKPFLAEANCLMLPSIREGMPIVILEAAAAKLPIIATPVGSIPDFLNNSNAYLSNLDVFHESMIDVILNYENTKPKADKLYDEVKSAFDINSVYNEHLKLYKSL